MLERFKVVCIPCKTLYKFSALPLPYLTGREMLVFLSVCLSFFRPHHHRHRGNPLMRCDLYSVRIEEFYQSRTVSAGVAVSSPHSAVCASRPTADEAAACLCVVSADARRRLPCLPAGLLANARLLRRHDDRRLSWRRRTQSPRFQLQYVTRILTMAETLCSCPRSLLRNVPTSANHYCIVFRVSQYFAKAV